MKVFVCDLGAFGTAAAIRFAILGHEVTGLIQPYNQSQKDLLWNLKNQTQNTNYLHLPGIELPSNITFTDGYEAVSAADIVFLAVPTKFIGNAFIEIKKKLRSNRGATLVLLSKGFDSYGKPWGVKICNNLRLELNSHNFAVISGFTPAADLAMAHLTKRVYAASLASRNLGVIKKLRGVFRNSGLDLSGTTDVAGVSWGGCLKNAYAIGYGLLISLARDKAWQYLELAHREMKIFLDYAGARPETWNSPAVRADFYLTSTGTISWESRNVRFGKWLAEYHPKEEIKSYTEDPRNTIEGYESMLVLWRIAHENSLRAPLIYGIHAICEYGASPDTLVSCVDRILKI